MFGSDDATSVVLDTKEINLDGHVWAGRPPRQRPRLSWRTRQRTRPMIGWKGGMVDLAQRVQPVPEVEARPY